MERASIFLIGECLLLLMSARVSAAPVLDQHQEAAGIKQAEFWDSVLLAQTFTAGESGVLDHLELGLSGVNAATVQIRDTVGGVPGTTVLGAVSMPSGFVDGWNTIDFLSQGINLTDGTTYAVVLANPNPSSADFVYVNWDPTSYTGGALWYNNNSAGWSSSFSYINTDYAAGGDMQFRTYVTIPVPSALILAGIGVGAVRWLRRSRSL